MIEILAGGFTKYGIVLVSQSGEIPGRFCDKCMFHGFSPVRNRRKERRIGFDQQPIERDGLGGFLELRGFLRTVEPFPAASSSPIS